MLCSKNNSKIKEKTTGLASWEPIPMFSGVNISANTRKRIKVLVFEEKKVEAR